MRVTSIKETQCSNYEKSRKNYQEQEKEEDKKRAPIFSGNADIYQRE